MAQLFSLRILKSAKEVINAIEKLKIERNSKSKTELVWLEKNLPHENYLEDVGLTYGPIKSLGIH